MASMEDKATNVETEDLHEFHKERWKQDDDKQNVTQDKLKILLVIFSMLVVITFLATVSILAWAYIEHSQNSFDKAQLHEPTRLYSSTAGTATMAQIFNTTNSMNGAEQGAAQRSSIPGFDSSQMHLFRVYEGLNTGAVCLDGTPPAYYLRPGKGLGANRWILHFNGGAWCFDEKACLERSHGSLGSTKHLPASPPVIQGINSPNEQINPDFYDWNLVWVVYCDGASFTGDREEPVVVGGENIFFRGKRVLDAVFDDLMKRGIQNAEGIILTGSSAGSMTAMFAIDRLAERLPNVPMHVLSDAGYFIETQMMGGKSVGAMFKKIYDMQNSSGGLNKDCIQGFGIQKGWHCFLPQHTFRFIKHPVYILNAAYDVWALLYFVGIDCKFPTVMQQNIQKKSEVQETNVTDHITSHRQIRDVSGFEIRPYFRTSEEIAKEEVSDDVTQGNLAKGPDIKKDIIPEEVQDPGMNQEKRNFEPLLSDSDLVDSLNTFGTRDQADNYYNERIPNPRIGEEAVEGPKLHLNIEQDASNEEGKMPNEVGGGTEFVNPDPDESLKLVNGGEENEKEATLNLNPLASSVSTLHNVAEDVQHGNMDTETMGLLNEVFKKLKRLMPKKKSNSTVPQKQNVTIAGLLKDKAVATNLEHVNTVNVGKNNEGGPYFAKNLSPKTVNKTDALKNINKEVEKQRAKDITAKLNDMLKAKQAEVIKEKKLHEEAKKQNHKPSNEIIANMFKKAGKLPNFLNSNANHPVRLQDLLQKGVAGLHKNSIAQNKNKRSANIIREYINILRSDPPECTENQMINVMKYRNAMLKATGVVKTTQNAGMFLVSCIEHSMSLFDETWTGVTVKQKSIQQAFGDWYYGRETNHIIIDGVYPTNLSCP
ncbi:uncharacterized protein LOC135683083 [Rhopilema esculentum]|uniref:uncharacterized protein LOC135683083 n=1 Tax=Rhopilema esculentum TaxID=499914 RepID=UPI0031D64FB4|eukprot:gene15450-6698_t